MKNFSASRSRINAVALAAMFAAVSSVLQFFEFPLPFIIPSFVKFDFSDLPALLASFSLGPVYGAVVCLVKNVIHLLVTQSGGVGELANFLIAVFFVVPAGIIYKLRRTRAGALAGSLAGTVAAAAASFPINLWISYPFYSNFMPIDTIIDMYNQIFNVVGELWQALLIFNLPFTALKCIVTALLALLLPIDAVLLLLCALFGGEFFATRSLLKRMRSDPALIGIIDNPQTAGGKADGTSASPSGTDGPGGSAE